MGTHPIFESDFDCLTEMATKSFLKYSQTQVHGGNIIPGYQLARFKPHRHRVLNLYKKAWRSLEKNWIGKQDEFPVKNMHDFCYERTLLRARFEENKHVTNLAKATELLKDGEEEYWITQGNYSYNDHVLPMSEGGIAFMRFENTSHPNDVMSQWGADEWARFPDIYDNQKKWHALRNDTWDEEMRTLEASDAKKIEAGERLTEDWPAAEAVDGPPPFWWRYVSRPLHFPSRPDFDYLEHMSKN